MLGFACFPTFSCAVSVCLIEFQSETQQLTTLNPTYIPPPPPQIRYNQKTIIVSGYSETEQVRKNLSLGAGRYIRKPYTLETIGMAIKTELEP